MHDAADRDTLADRRTAAEAWRVCAAGALALAVAMGIGRFAFTPLLPLMLREGLLDADGGAWLAAVNYAGYLVGALSAAHLATRPRRLVLFSLAAIALVTAAAGLVHSLPAWLLLRGAAGVLSAWVLVGVSSWAIGELARRGHAHAGGWVFAGVGLGITLAGGLAWWGRSAPALWLGLGALAALLTLAVWQGWPAQGTAGGAASTGPTAPEPLPRGSAGLVFCYGSFGFGYILPATYLPALARALVDDPRLFGLAWPVFGAAAALSTLLAGRALRRWRLLQVWAACHALMALGTALPLLSHSGAAIGLSALLVGGSFMVATMAGLQQARALAPRQPAPLLSRMTAAFAAGQIAGPLVALGLSRLLPASLVGADGSGIAPTLALATALLCGTGLWLYRQAGRR